MFSTWYCDRDFKNLARRRASDKFLRDKAFNIAKNAKYDGYLRSLPSIVYQFFDKKSTGSGATTLANEPVFRNEITQNLQLAEELHKPMIKKLEKITVYSGLKGNIWGTDLADMQSISKLNNWFRFLLIFLVNILRLFLWEKKKVKHC